MPCMFPIAKAACSAPRPRRSFLVGCSLPIPPSLPFWGSVQLQLPLALPLLLLLTHNNVALYSGAVVFHDSGLHKGVGCYEWKRKRQLTIGSHRSSQSTVSVPGTTFVEERCEVWEYGSRVVSGRDDVSPDRLLASVERFLQKHAASNIHGP